MKALLGGNAGALLQTALGGMVHSSPDLEVQDFLHAGTKVRGVGTRVALEVGEPAIVAPKELQLRTPWRGSRFDALENDLSRLGFWLAEQRAKLPTPAENSAAANNSDQDWQAAYIRSLPTLEEYRDAGIPLVAPSEDLKQLSGLPKLGEVARYVEEQRAAISADLGKYSEKTVYPKLSLEDALWGRTVAMSRAMMFGKCAPMAMVPVADMLNSSEHSANVQSICDGDSGTIIWRPLRHINAGEELTQKFDLHGQLKSVDMVKFFGFLPEGTIQEHWSESECSVIKHADLTHSRGSLLKTLGKLAEQNCAEPAKAPVVQSNLVAQSVAPLSLLSPWAVADLSTAMRAARCCVRTSDFLNVDLSNESVA